MVFVLQLIVNTITVKVSVGFFRFPSNSKEFKKLEHLNRLNSLIDTNVIAILIKKAVNRTVSFVTVSADLWPHHLKYDKYRKIITNVLYKEIHIESLWYVQGHSSLFMTKSESLIGNVQGQFVCL